LRENVAGAGFTLSDDDLAELDKIGRWWASLPRSAVS
jgi:hypothetical protein